jgi:histidinol phosphatase-like enzyme (inositol monophosphatase family)
MTYSFPEDLKQTALKAVTVANKITLDYFRKAILIDNKHAHNIWDPVTIADKQAEQAIRDIISLDFPTHGIIGEEYQDKSAQSDYTWIIDPIDGTRAFITGLPMWGTLIGVLYQQKPIFGLMAQPFVGDIFYGDCKTAFLKNHHYHTEQQLQTRTTSDINDTIMFCTTPDMFQNPHDLNQFNALKNICKTVRYGTDCYGYAVLAAGWGDIVFEANVNNYDIYPMIPIITGAGGYISAPDGSDFTKGSVIASSNKILHDKALALLNALI